MGLQTEISFDGSAVMYCVHSACSDGPAMEMLNGDMLQGTLTYDVLADTIHGQPWECQGRKGKNPKMEQGKMLYKCYGNMDIDDTDWYGWYDDYNMTTTGSAGVDDMDWEMDSCWEWMKDWYPHDMNPSDDVDTSEIETEEQSSERSQEEMDGKTPLDCQHREMGTSSSSEMGSSMNVDGGSMNHGEESEEDVDWDATMHETMKVGHMLDVWGPPRMCGFTCGEVLVKKLLEADILDLKAPGVSSM